jgi:hypothetical protein
LGRGDGRNKTVVEEEKKMSWEEDTVGIRRKTIAEGIQQWREENELGRGDGRNKKEGGCERREEDELGRGGWRLRREAERDGKDRQVKPNR